MSNFGTILDTKKTVLTVFYNSFHSLSDEMHPMIKGLACEFRNKVDVIKMDILKNEELTDALRIKSLPTYIIWRKGEMMWRQSTNVDSSLLKRVLNDYITK